MGKNMKAGEILRKVCCALIMAMALVVTGLPVSSGMETRQIQAAAKIKLSKTKATIYVGKTLTLKLKNATDTVTWASSKEKIATVSSKGTVTAKKAGKTNIVAVHKGKMYTCKVTVKAAKKLSGEQIYEKCLDCVASVHVKTVDGGNYIGSGFFVDEYTFVTNHHVIEGAKSIYITMFKDGKNYDVTEVLGDAPELDLAILKVKCKGKAIPRNTHGVSTGETVYTFGAPDGLDNTIAAGIVANKSRKLSGYSFGFIQTDAATAPGSSGSPLINSYGEVIGVHSRANSDVDSAKYSIPIEKIDEVDITHPVKVENYANGGKTDDRSPIEIFIDYLTTNGEYHEKSQQYNNWIWFKPAGGDKYGFLARYYLDSNWPIQMNLYNNYETTETMDVWICYNKTDDRYEMVANTVDAEGNKVGEIRTHINPTTFTGEISKDDVTSYTEDETVSKNDFIKGINSMLPVFKEALIWYLENYQVGITFEDLGFKKW